MILFVVKPNRILNFLQQCLMRNNINKNKTHYEFDIKIGTYFSSCVTDGPQSKN